MEDVWKSFWRREREDRQIDIRRGDRECPSEMRVRLLVATFSSVSPSAVKVFDGAQKQVTRMISCLADKMAGMRVLV